MPARTVNGLRIRRALGRDAWGAPVPQGPDGFSFVDRPRQRSIIVTAANWEDGCEWIHASIAHVTRMPTYDELCELRDAVYGDGYAYQVFAPPSKHVNIHEYALHLWGRADGRPALPDFGQYGTI